MTAKELFEKLGYMQSETENYIRYENDKTKYDKIVIYFKYDIKEMILISNNKRTDINSIVDLSLEECHAIMQQMQELGWFND